MIFSDLIRDIEIIKNALDSKNQEIKELKEEIKKLANMEEKK